MKVTTRVQLQHRNPIMSEKTAKKKKPRTKAKRKPAANKAASKQSKRKPAVKAVTSTKKKKKTTARAKTKKVAPAKKPPKKAKARNHKRKSKVFRMQCMHAWATGLTLRGVAKEKEVSLTSLQSWKSAHDPERWDDYRDAFVRDLQDEQIQAVRGEFASMIAGQLEDVKALRTLARTLMAKFTTRLIKKKFVLSEAEARIVRHIAFVISQVQKQTGSIFGLPTHRITEEVTAAPLAAFLDDDVDIDSLSDREIVGMIGELAKSDNYEDTEYIQ